MPRAVGKPPQLVGVAAPRLPRVSRLGRRHQVAADPGHRHVVGQEDRGARLEAGVEAVEEVAQRRPRDVGEPEIGEAAVEAAGNGVEGEGVAGEQLDATEREAARPGAGEHRRRGVHGRHRPGHGGQLRRPVAGAAGHLEHPPSAEGRAHGRGQLSLLGAAGRLAAAVDVVVLRRPAAVVVDQVGRLGGDRRHRRGVGRGSLGRCRLSPTRRRGGPAHPGSPSPTSRAPRS